MRRAEDRGARGGALAIRRVSRGSRHRAAEAPRSTVLRAVALISLSALAGISTTTATTAALWKGTGSVGTALATKAGIFYSVTRLDDLAAVPSKATASTSEVGITITQSDVTAMLADAGKKITIPIVVNGRLDQKAQALKTVLNSGIGTGGYVASMAEDTVLAASTFALVQKSVTEPVDPATMCTVSPDATDLTVVAAGQPVRTGKQYWCLTITYTPPNPVTTKTGKLTSTVKVKVKESVGGVPTGDEVEATDTWDAYRQGDVTLLWWKHTAV